jgi:hypothetical protein
MASVGAGIRGSEKMREVQPESAVLCKLQATARWHGPGGRGTRSCMNADRRFLCQRLARGMKLQLLLRDDEVRRRVKPLVRQDWREQPAAWSGDRQLKVTEPRLQQPGAQVLIGRSLCVVGGHADRVRNGEPQLRLPAWLTSGQTRGEVWQPYHRVQDLDLCSFSPTSSSPAVQAENLSSRRACSQRIATVGA